MTGSIIHCIAPIEVQLRFIPCSGQGGTSYTGCCMRASRVPACILGSPEVFHALRIAQSTGCLGDSPPTIQRSSQSWLQISNYHNHSSNTITSHSSVNWHGSLQLGMPPPPKVSYTKEYWFTTVTMSNPFRWVMLVPTWSQTGHVVPSS